MAIKALSIIYLSTIYFIIVFGSAILFNKLIPYESEKAEKKKSKVILFIESLIIFSLAGVLFYLIRKIAKKFPNFFDKYGVKAVKLKEYQGGVLLGALFMLFQNKLINKLKLVIN